MKHTIPPPTKTKGFGRRQLWALKWLLADWYISEVDMPGNGTRDIVLTNGGDVDRFSKSLLEGLMKRQILNQKLVYSTVQPDSFHYHYKLKPELKETVQRIVNHYSNQS